MILLRLTAVVVVVGVALEGVDAAADAVVVHACRGHNMTLEKELVPIKQCRTKEQPTATLTVTVPKPGDTLTNFYTTHTWTSIYELTGSYGIISRVLSRYGQKLYYVFGRTRDGAWPPKVIGDQQAVVEGEDAKLSVELLLPSDGHKAVYQHYTGLTNSDGAPIEWLPKVADGDEPHSTRADPSAIREHMRKKREKQEAAKRRQIEEALKRTDGDVDKANRQRQARKHAQVVIAFPKANPTPKEIKLQVLEADGKWKDVKKMKGGATKGTAALPTHAECGGKLSYRVMADEKLHKEMAINVPACEIEQKREAFVTTTLSNKGGELPIKYQTIPGQSAYVVEQIDNEATREANSTGSVECETAGACTLTEDAAPTYEMSTHRIVAANDKLTYPLVVDDNLVAEGQVLDNVEWDGPPADPSHNVINFCIQPALGSMYCHQLGRDVTARKELRVASMPQRYRISSTVDASFGGAADHNPANPEVDNYIEVNSAGNADWQNMTAMEKMKYKGPPDFKNSGAGAAGLGVCDVPIDQIHGKFESGTARLPVALYAKKAPVVKRNRKLKVYIDKKYKVYEVPYGGELLADVHQLELFANSSFDMVDGQSNIANLRGARDTTDNVPSYHPIIASSDQLKSYKSSYYYFQSDKLTNKNAYKAALTAYTAKRATAVFAAAPPRSLTLIDDATVESQDGNEFKVSMAAQPSADFYRLRVDEDTNIAVGDAGAMNFDEFAASQSIDHALPATTDGGAIDALVSIGSDSGSSANVNVYSAKFIERKSSFVLPNKLIRPKLRYAVKPSTSRRHIRATVYLPDVKDDEGVMFQLVSKNGGETKVIGDIFAVTISKSDSRRRTWKLIWKYDLTKAEFKNHADYKAAKSKNVEVIAIVTPKPRLPNAWTEHAREIDVAKLVGDDSQKMELQWVPTELGDTASTLYFAVYIKEKGRERVLAYLPSNGRRYIGRKFSSKDTVKVKQVILSRFVQSFPEGCAIDLAELVEEMDG